MSLIAGTSTFDSASTTISKTAAEATGTDPVDASRVVGNKDLGASECRQEVLAGFAGCSQQTGNMIGSVEQMSCAAVSTCFCTDTPYLGSSIDMNKVENICKDVCHPYL